MAIVAEFVDGMGDDTELVRHVFEEPELGETLADAFRPGRRWRVVAPDGSVWCESSSEQENRDAMRRGDKLYRIWRVELTEWREAD
jgi:hypothetical protein